VVSLTNQRKRSLTATFPWCTLRVVGSFLIQEKLVLEKTKRRKLGSSKIGFFTLILLHRELPLERVSQVCVKLYPSGRIHVIFLVEEAEPLGKALEQPKKALWVLTWGSRGLPLSPMVSTLRTQNLLSTLLKESWYYRGRSLERGFSRRTGSKRR